MAVVKHTPGPWKAETKTPTDNATVFAVDDGGLEWPAPIADCTDFERRRPVEEAQANARLIAASPSMLAALRLASAALRWAMDDQGVDGDSCCALVAAEGRPDLPRLPITISLLIEHIDEVVGETGASA